MASIPYALSVQHFINSVGAKAGFASIIGLALLVLLFFTQSRETANLRRRADEAEEHLQQLQLYVDHLSRQRSQPAPAPAAAQQTGAPVAAPPAAALARAGGSRTIPGERAASGAGVATIPGAPAGVGAPALSSATRLIPLADPGEISIRALRQSTNGGGGPHAPDATVATPPPGPAPSTAAGGNGANGGNGVARPPVPVPMPTMAGPATEPAPPPRVALPGQARPIGRPPVSPAPPRRGGRGSHGDGRRTRPLLVILGGVMAVVVAVFAVILLTGSSNNTPSASSSSSSPASVARTNAARGARNTKHAKTAAATSVTPGAVTVAVLNGTSTNHLAADVLGKLTAAGYHGGPTQNAAEAGVTSTIVGYTQTTYRADALAVARSLNLSPASVQGVSQGDRTKVCGSGTACPDQVVVTVGADLAQTG